MNENSCLALRPPAVSKACGADREAPGNDGCLGVFFWCLARGSAPQNCLMVRKGF
jgi:hypothetical protein